MKKIFVLMVLCTLSMSVSAQAVDSLQSNPISIDSLAVKLDKLQKDYDYLYCRYAIENTLNQFDDIANQANIKSNALLIEYYNHSKVDIELYIANRNYYDSLISLFNSAKERLVVSVTTT